MRLDPAACQLLVIDFQERLYAAMPEAHREHARKAAENLVWLARELGMPITTTEQYPQGLGPTIPSLGTTNPVTKLTFSALGAPEEGQPAAADALVRPRTIVFGMETHICVALTVQDLRARGTDVLVVQDACLSRRKSDWNAGLSWMQQLGASVLPHETVLFGLIGRASGPVFKEASRRIR